MTPRVGCCRQRKASIATPREHLRLYIAGLHANPQTSRELNQRNVELVTLFEAWTDLLGDAHAMLYTKTNPDGTPVHAWQDDDYFYHAQGLCARDVLHDARGEARISSTPSRSSR